MCVLLFVTEAFRIDPCYSYTALDDPWRATDNHNSYNCDASVNWDGWYRLFIAGQDAQMPETCVNQFSCGTVAPLWLNGQHPRVEDGVVTRHVCGHWNNDCCNFEFNPMKVKACPGNYYVYEFMNPVFCSVAYCAGKYIYIQNCISVFLYLTNIYPKLYRSDEYQLYRCHATHHPNW